VSDPTWDDIRGEVPHLTYRQFNTWISANLIQATWLRSDGGSGDRRTMTWAEVDVLTLMADLVHAGMTPKAAAPLARLLAAEESAPLGSFRLYHAGASS